MSTTKETFEDRLLPMLVDAAPARRRSQRLRVGGVATAVVAALAVASLSLGPAVGSDTVTVSASDAVADPAATEQLLRQAGIDATVILVPVSPRWAVLNHTWWWLHFDGPAAMSQEDFANIYRQVGDGLSGLTSAEADHGNGIQHMADLELPKNLPGHLTLFAAEVVEGPHVGSDYDVINELSPVGTFWCDRLDPNNPAALGHALKAKGYDVIWVLEPEDDKTDGPWSTPASPPSGTVVTWAWLRGPHTVDIRLMQSGSSAREYQQSEGTFLPTETPPWAPGCP